MRELHANVFLRFLISLGRVKRQKTLGPITPLWLTKS